ncbi:MAG: GYD domain-containing protein [Dehalococcoidia bacterium]
MAIYVTLINFTEQGIKNIKESPQRVAAARQAIEAAGGKMLGFYWTLGQYDAIAIGEAPSDEVYTAIILAIAGQGNIRSTTLKAFNEAEIGRVIANMP